MTVAVSARSLTVTRFAVMVIAATIRSLLPLTAQAACNLIPQTVKTYDSVLGSINRPFAAPGEPVEIRVRPCDRGSAGFSATLTDQNVTVVFTPAGGTPNAVVLTAAADCSGLTSQLTACQAQLAGGQVSCVAGTAAGLQLLAREDGAHLQFLFPDTTALLNSGAGRTLSGPATVAVSPAAAALPCGLTLTNGCALQTGLIACVDDFFSNDGTCTSTRPQGVFNHFTALPVPNDFGTDCTAQAPPCANTPSEFRLTADKDGNLLLPMNWQKILVRQNGTPFPRLLRALLSAPAPVNVGPSFAASFTPEGGPLAPIFVPQVDLTTPRTVVNLFGSADAPYTILRVARRSASFQQCVGGAYTSLGAVPCNSSDECPAVCDGGTNPGQFCTSNSDCTGGGSCGAAGTCGPTVCYVGGTPTAQPCTSDTNCPGGECGPSAFNAGLLGLLAFHGVGPVIIPQAVNTCAAGTNATQACTGNSDCPSGICIQNGICQQSGATCGVSSACSTGTGPCVQYTLTAENPIPLQSLAAQADQVFGFTAQEQVDTVDRNGDGDTLDYVVTLRDRTTGAEQFLGAPAGCGISGTPEGRAVVALHQPPFVFPAVVTQGDALALLESEAQENACDENANGAIFDSILRVFRLGPPELTAGRVETADAAPVINGGSLAVSNGLVFFRASEAARARQVTSRVSVDSAGTQGNNDIAQSVYPSISADGRYVAFMSGATNLVPGDTNGVYDIFVHDGVTGVTERASVDSAGGQGNDWSEAASISADGRYVAFHSYATNLVPGGTNGVGYIFVHDRLTGVTERVSVSSAGAPANLDSLGPSISADGRYVAFWSGATNLVSGRIDYNNHIFVHDHLTGVTERVSVNSAGAPADGDSFWPSISADGRYVAFLSDATNLVPGDTNGVGDVFVHDRLTGATERVSVDSAGVQGNNDSFTTSISADGRYVAFDGGATNLVPSDTNGVLDVFVHDRLTGATERVSLDSAGGQGDNASALYSISADGRYVAFDSGATNLVPGDTNGVLDAFIHDRLTGATERVSVDSAGVQGNNDSGYASISAGGRYVAFASYATNLVPNDTNGGMDVFVHGPDPTDLASDITGDGDLNDTVLEQLDTASSTVTTLCPAEQVAVAAGVAAFLRPEAAGATPHLAGCPTVPAGTDDLVHLARGGTVTNLALAASAVSISAQCSGGSNAGQICDVNTDCSSGTCTASWVAALATAAVPGRTELEVHPAAGGSWTDVGQAADSAQVSGALVVFITPEAAQSTDLNGDHDTSDRVIQLYDAAAAQLTNLGQAAEEFVAGTQTPTCAQSPVIAFRTSEAAQRADLNGDGDKTDFVMQFYAKGLGVVNTGQAVTPCNLQACDPRYPYQVNNGQVKFLTLESDQRQDLNGDGDQDDLILQIYDVCTGVTTVVGAVDTTVTTADPLTAGGTTNPATAAASVVVTTGNRCFTTATTCTSDTDCAAPAVCNVSGVCATMTPVPPSCATSADCPGAATCLPDRIVAAPAVAPAQHDSVLLPPAPLTVTIPKGKSSSSKILKLGVRNADIGPPVEQPGHIIQISASDGTCPSGTVAGPANFSKASAPPQNSVLLAGGKMAVASIPLRIPSGAFASFNKLAPTRCTLQIAATTLLANGQDNRDPSPSNNLIGVELNVVDLNDTPQTSVHESYISSSRPVAFKIPRDRTGQDSNVIAKMVSITVGNADVAPVDTDSITVSASDGTCPVGTVAGVNFAPHNSPPTSVASVTGGKRAPGRLTLSLSAAGFATHNGKAPSRCAVQLRTTGPSNADPSPANNVTNLTIDVIDSNDF